MLRVMEGFYELRMLPQLSQPALEQHPGQIFFVVSVVHITK